MMRPSALLQSNSRDSNWHLRPSNSLRRHSTVRKHAVMSNERYGAKKGDYV